MEAREHALVRSLAKSRRIGRLIGTGQPGIEDDAETVAISADDLPSLIAFVVRRGSISP